MRRSFNQLEEQDRKRRERRRHLRTFIECIPSGVAIVVIVILFAYGGAYAVASLTAKKQCLQRGWANSSVTWDLQGFCIREENEYEITVPLADLEIAPQSP